MPSTTFLANKVSIKCRNLEVPYHCPAKYSTHTHTRARSLHPSYFHALLFCPKGYKGVQSYPSRTKDSVEVDFSTGSVGLGAAITTFSALIQEYIKHHDWQAGLQESEERDGRMIALVGDAEVSVSCNSTVLMWFARGAAGNKTNLARFAARRRECLRMLG
jgi:hypothetical protein